MNNAKPTPSLEAQLLMELREINRVLKKDHGYVPTRFNEMVAEHGPVQAIKRLLATEVHQEGLNTLLLYDKLNMSVESVIQNPKWHPLFTPQERAIARERLQKMGSPPPNGK